MRHEEGALVSILDEKLLEQERCIEERKSRMFEALKDIQGLGGSHDSV